MDPNTNLAEQRRLVEKMDADGLDVDPEDAMRLCEYVAALDAWIMRGGALPDAWKR